MEFKAMFSPLTMGPVTVKNRFVVPPMCNNFANPDGSLSDRSLAYYRERARGGFGLITVEATVIDRRSKASKSKVCLFDDLVIDSFRRVANACHAEGARLSVQLQHAGPEGSSGSSGYPICAASSIAASAGRDIPLTLSKDEIYEIIELYGDAAERAMKAGVDAVEVHCAHGYLVSSFMSPRTNKRVDEFGGSFENRMRLPRLIIENIRKKTGKSLAVLCRINSSDEVPGGLDVHDSAAVAMYLEDCGVDGLHVSRAVHLKDEYMWAPTVLHGGFNAELVSEIKRAVSIPVIAVGRFTEPHYAELLVREGRCDLVAFGRQSIADPHTPRKIAEGKFDEITPCIACLQGCVERMFKGQPICCMVNPLVGKESEGTGTSDTPRKIVVIGGGVGGMLAAWVSAARGHEVILLEKSGTLGGQMRLAAYPPGKGDITNMVRSLISKCEYYGVDVRLNTSATQELIEELAPDAVIVATGSRPLTLPIPGIELEEVLHAVDVLEGNASCGKKVLVIGGGMIGSETAAFLAERGHEVAVIEMRDEVGADVRSEHRKFLMNDFKEYGISAITGAKVKEITPHGAVYTKEDGTEASADGFDTVILALGVKSYDPLSSSLKNIISDTYVIGDAQKTGKAIDATVAACELALKL